MPSKAPLECSARKTCETAQEFGTTLKNTFEFEVCRSTIPSRSAGILYEGAKWEMSD